MNEVFFWQCVASVMNSLCLATYVPDEGDSDRVWNRNLFHLDRADSLRKLQVNAAYNEYTSHALAEVCGTLFLSSFLFF